MTLSRLNILSNSSAWDEKWKGLFDHYQQDLRHSYYIHAMLDVKDLNILEIAAGSFRDMAELRRRGVDCQGMDFSRESVNLAKLHYPEFAKYMHQLSAFQMPFSDNEFDVSYHNGFWVLFDDVQIKLLLAEQARITKNKIISTVHNAHNKQFVDYFERLKKNDPLYDVRFFDIDEISSLMRMVCKDVLVIPVGKGKKYHEDLLISQDIKDPQTLRRLFESNGLNHLESSERLMCIGTLCS